MVKPGKFPSGKTEIPFEFPLHVKGNKVLYETYHGVFVNIQVSSQQAVAFTASSWWCFPGNGGGGQEWDPALTALTRVCPGPAPRFPRLALPVRPLFQGGPGDPAPLKPLCVPCAVQPPGL